MNIFPFCLPDRVARALFQQYVAAHRDELHEKYGHVCFVGTLHRGGNHYAKLWSWYDVDAEVLSPTEVKFITYDMAGPPFGGRGAKQEEILHTLTSAALAKSIERYQLELATREYDTRLRQRQERERNDGIRAIHHELFGATP